MNQRQSTNKKSQDKNELYESSVIKAIFKIATPIILFSLVLAIYGVIDSLMAVNLVEYSDSNENPSQYLGFVVPYLGIFVSFLTLFIVGNAIYYAKCFGQRNYIAD